MGTGETVEPEPEPEPEHGRRRLGAGAAVVLVVVALAVTVGIGVVRSATAPVVEIDGPASPTATGAAPAGVYVHVAGAVRAPGLYVLAPGSRVVDAVAAAGGFSPEADPGGVNLARSVSDGEQLHVPREGETAPDGGSAGVGSDGRVNLNTADLAALETLPRVGPTLAQRIIDWRDANGAFAAVDDLLAVAGFGEKMVAALRDLVTV
ncbi:ComEA family DNA-binding protein [Microbacterium thalassium]|uniref:Competence protein ComEA n=1 Tax=Microbacterium thalassium TaxID=362649 RepID=A0A7X0FRZ8_9MICO|nr:ComEA family DNA-binding protein [Microbacterium thalassium]MBB6392017.1 competence protein ComEA [Microbacterium thalassium]GLK25023.1 competence protein ComEA [Microbacterium thalassium]